MSELSEGAAIPELRVTPDKYLPHRYAGASGDFNPIHIDEEFAGQHYAEHTEKPFFGELVEFITGGPLVAAVFEGPHAVAAARPQWMLAPRSATTAPRSCCGGQAFGP